MRMPNVAPNRPASNETLRLLVSAWFARQSKTWAKVNVLSMPTIRVNPPMATTAKESTTSPTAINPTIITGIRIRKPIRLASA